jgi:hypothetical protein
METDQQHNTATGRAIEIPIITFPGIRRWLVGAFASPTVRVEVSIVLLLTVIAGIIRIAALTDIPPGLHGDEGLAGIDGQRIMREGWIGPYLPSALGTPSGTFYGSGALFKACDLTGFCEVGMFTDRLVFAMMGIITVPLTYGAFRLMFNRRVGLLAAVILSVLYWHVHLSRAAFTPVSWPLMQMGTLFFVALGLKIGRSPFGASDPADRRQFAKAMLCFVAAGLCFGGGPYGYMGFPAFMVVFAGYLSYVFVREYLGRWREFVAYMAVFGFCALLIALPLIQFATKPDTPFFDRYRIYSITKTDGYKQADSPYEKVEFFTGRAREYFGGFGGLQPFWERKPTFDGVDALGIKPILDGLSPFLMIGGLIIAFRYWKRPEYVLPILMLVVAPNAALWSADGMYRRTIGLAPFMALLAALPLALLWQAADRWQSWARYSSYYAIAGIVALIAFLNLNTYFTTYDDNVDAKWVFVHEFTEAADYLHDVEPKPYVYFYSARWSYDYETRLFLLPDYQGEDRSKEFGKQVLDTTRTDDGEVVYLFLPPYFEVLPQVVQQYPGGTLTEGRDGNGTLIFQAYLLPARTPATAAAAN